MKGSQHDTNRTHRCNRNARLTFEKTFGNTLEIAFEIVLYQTRGYHLLSSFQNSLWSTLLKIVLKSHVPAIYMGNPSGLAFKTSFS